MRGAVRTFSRLVAVLVLIAFLPFSARALTLGEELKLGRESYAQIVGSVGVFYDPLVSLHIDSIKRRLEGVANLPFPIVLTVIESREINAFATFGGYVYLTTGLIADCEKEEELAGVMAHEFAHILKRHISKRVEKQKYYNAGMVASMLLGALVGAPVAMLGQAALTSVALKYSRDDEEEADRAGAQIAEKAGYGSAGIIDFLKRLRNMGSDKMLPQYLLTHPYPDERVIRLEALGVKKFSSVDTSLFPYLSARVSVVQKDSLSNVRDAWMRRYERDRKNQVHAYGASLGLLASGKPAEALKIIEPLDFPLKNVSAAEILLQERKPVEAVRLLQDRDSPSSRFFLAKAYENMGNFEMAAGILYDLLPYAEALPDIYMRLGMIAGRTGNEGRGFEYLGRYYMATGNYDLARTNLEKAVAKYGINSYEAKRLMTLLDKLKGS